MEAAEAEKLVLPYARAICLCLWLQAVIQSFGANADLKLGIQ
jgi:hypothetical protein